MVIFRRGAHHFCRYGGRLKLLLLVSVTFGLTYIVLLSYSVPSRTLINNYGGLKSLATAGASRALSDEAALLDSENAEMGSLLENATTNSGHIVDGGQDAMERANISNVADMPECPLLSEIQNYIVHLPQATLLIEDLKEEEVHALHSDVMPGGVWKPSKCRARNRVAVIIPYRDRKSHLTRLLDFLIPILKQQQLDFRFIVTEQYGEDLFNKGRIMNAAFQLAQKLNVECVVFHDVDMFPQDDRTPYDCPESPRHLGAFVSNLGYQLWYKEIVGGALAINIKDYLAVNGYSNLYYGWGGEDDDMGKRILSLNYTIERPDGSYARFSMLKHTKRKRTAPKLIYKLLDSAGTRWTHDGVNETGLWKIMRVDKRPLSYHLLVDVGESPSYWRSQ